MTYQYRSEVLEDLHAGKISNLEAFLQLDRIIQSEESAKSQSQIVAELKAKTKPGYEPAFDAYNADEPTQQEAF